MTKFLHLLLFSSLFFVLGHSEMNGQKVDNDNYNDILSQIFELQLDEVEDAIGYITEGYCFVDVVDEASVPRRFNNNFSCFVAPIKQNYFDFLLFILPVAPTRGAPYIVDRPFQQIGYGLLYLQYLF